MKFDSMAVYEAGKPLRKMEVEVEQPLEEEEALLVKIGGAGMCRTDLRLWYGMEPRLGFKLPFVLGHENAGVVYDCGNLVEGVKKGDQVIVYSVWGDLTCRNCKRGEYMMCRNQKIPGQSYYYGGYAELIYVPSYRYVVKIEGLDLVGAAPLADAGVTSYSAVRKLLPFLYPDSTVIAYGIGGLASYAIQILKQVLPDVNVIAVSRNRKKLEWALELGADFATVVEDLKKLLEHHEDAGRKAAAAAIDFVGTEESTMRIADCLDSGGAIVEVGMEGDKLSMPTFGTTVWQHHLIGSNYGTFDDLSKIVELVKKSAVKSYVIRRKLSEVNEALLELKEGSALGRYVLVP
jgi:D-arabinose 1-dehydrogenase